MDVVSLDWKWLFIYPEQRIATVNQLVVPAGTPVSFRLTSATVMNSFFVPQLGSQIYTMPGMATQLNLLADKPGAYQGLSAQFSGDGFADMRFTVTAVPAGDFDGWVAKVRGDWIRARQSRLWRIDQGEPCGAADDVSLGRPGAVRAHHRPDGAEPGQGARRQCLVSTGAAGGGRLRCWAG